MMKVLIAGVYTIILSAGLLQLFLIPGLLWNLMLPIIPCLLIVLFLLNNRLKRNRYLKMCTVLLSTLMILEVGFNMYTSLNTHAPKQAKELKIMSYNLFFKNSAPSNSLAIIKKHNPDLLFVQELTPAWKSTLDKTLVSSHPYRLSHALRGTHGIGIYSKYQLSQHKLINNQNKKPYAQTAVLQIDNKSIQLINTHLASPAIAIENPDRFLTLYAKNYQVRKAQLNHLNLIAEKDTDKYSAQILAGDLNILKYEPIFKKARLRWTNAFSNHLSLRMQNFPNSNKIPPLVMLDYIMARGVIKIKNAKVLKGGSSDHLAILAQVEI